MSEIVRPAEKYGWAIQERDPRLAGMPLRRQNWTPASLSGLVAWYEADRITGVLADGTAVASWTDLSGHGYDLNMSTGAFQPIFKTNILNSKPCVRFDGTDDFLIWDVAHDQVQPITVAAVMTLPNDIEQVIFADHGNGGNGCEWWMGGGVLLLWAGVSSSTGISVPQAAAIYVSVFDGASSAMYQNGSGGITGNAGTTGLSRLRLAQENPAAANYWYSGDMFSFLVCTGSISTADRDALENYWGQKYGIAVV